MAIPSRQIGWGTEDNLLWQISKQLERLTCVTAGGCGAITTTTTTTTLPVYRVYTALLTQSGGDDPRNVPTDTNSLIKGITYEIVSVGAGEDMTLYGAPNNDPGTYFICTVDTEVFTSELNYNQAAPVVNVLENTIGNVWFTYSDIGNYFINSNDLFTQNKTLLFASSMNNGNDTNNHTATVYATTSQLTFNSWGNTGDNYAELDNYIPLPIEIRVYN
jgi:hypothetical protein